MQTSNCILCINADSSSLKAALFTVNPPEEPKYLTGIEASGIGEDDARLAWQIGTERRERPRSFASHLGNGASLAALRDGRPIDTTMGYTPAGGLMMGTRTGDIDPGALIAWLRRGKAGADELERLVNLESGLAGVAGGESSMEALLEQAADDDAAEQAIALFCYIARKHLGAMIAALGGIDTLVFTGGIGEHAPPIRERILEGLDELGLALDARANAAGKPNLESQHSRAGIRVIATDEDAVIARHAAALIARKEQTP